MRLIGTQINKNKKVVVAKPAIFITTLFNNMGGLIRITKLSHEKNDYEYFAERQATHI